MKQETMTNNEISDLVAEIAGKCRFELEDNVQRDTLARRKTNDALAHVMKSLFRLFIGEGGREGARHECIQAITYLMIVYKIRKEPYGEY